MNDFDYAFDYYDGASSPINRPDDSMAMGVSISGYSPLRYPTSPTMMTDSGFLDVPFIEQPLYTDSFVNEMSKVVYPIPNTPVKQITKTQIKQTKAHSKTPSKSPVILRPFANFESVETSVKSLNAFARRSLGKP